MLGIKFLDIFKLWANKDEKEYSDNIDNDIVSIAPHKNEDGAIETEIDSRSYAGMSGVHQQFYSGQDPNIQNKVQLINTYRQLMSYPEVENAVSEIIDDAIVNEKDHDVVSIELEKTNFSESIKDKINKEFKDILSLYNFDFRGSKLFKDWYVDSRIYFHKIVSSSGELLELRQLNPKNLELRRDIVTKTEEGVSIVVGTNEYFVYTVSEDNFRFGRQVFSKNDQVRIPRSAIIYAHSGLLDCRDNVIGYLHRAIKPANQLRLLEDAMVIYRITRAPERRIFYIDVGQMGGKKAQQYVDSIANSLKNRVVYDSSTGKIKTAQHNLAMTEDYWLTRRDGKAVTSVETLPGMSGMDQMDDVRWFNKKLYEALRVPLSRIPRDDGGLQLGGADGSITRDEMKFSKFIRTLQVQFSEIFSDPLKYILINKKIITEDEWNTNVNHINFVFHQDSYYAEMKDLEILERRASVWQNIEPIVGKFISHKYVMKQVFRMSDDDVKTQEKEIQDEQTDPRFKNNSDEPGENF
ncbi:portal protein [Morganella phage vB_Mm5]